MKRKVAILLILILCYLMVIVPFTSYLKNKPYIEKLGYVPKAEIVKLLSGDQHQFIAAALVMKVMAYFGGLVEQAQQNVHVPPDYYNMYKTIENAVKLDPYNMDAYYFGQATLAWDLKRIQEANELLEYGMKYRTWDFYLPFFAGFNYAFFLKDYDNAARYYQRVGDLTGSELPINLAGRYLYESGQTDLAIAYLSTMAKSARNEAIKKTFQIRLTAFQQVKQIEQAIARYRQKTGHGPTSIKDLLNKGILQSPPVDPYGGTFFIDAHGRVRSSSNFAYAATKR